MVNNCWYMDYQQNKGCKTGQTETTRYGWKLFVKTWQCLQPKQYMQWLLNNGLFGMWLDTSWLRMLNRTKWERSLSPVSRNIVGYQSLVQDGNTLDKKDCSAYYSYHTDYGVFGDLHGQWMSHSFSLNLRVPCGLNPNCCHVDKNLCLPAKS